MYSESSKKMLICTSLDDWATKCWPLLVLDTHAHVCMYRRMHTCIYYYIYIHIYKQIHTYTYTNILVYMCTCAHVHIHINHITLRYFKCIIICTDYTAKHISAHVQNRWSLGICSHCILGSRSSQRGKALRIPCGHLFHEDCVKELLMELYFLCFRF